MSDAGQFSPAATLVRRHDRDRFLTALAAPAEKREALFALYAFNYEIARIRESVTETMLGRIRLQWWREAIAEIYAGGRVRRHEVAEPLAEAARRHRLSREHLDRLVNARESDLDNELPQSLAALEVYCEETSSRLVWLALEALGAGGSTVEPGRRVGLAWALTGLIRAIPFHARQKRSFIPADLAAATGIDLGDLFELRSTPAIREAVQRLGERAEKHLAAARAARSAVPRAALPALLPATLASAYLRRLKRAGSDPFDPRLARPDPFAPARIALAVFARRY